MVITARVNEVIAVREHISNNFTDAPIIRIPVPLTHSTCTQNKVGGYSTMCVAFGERWCGVEAL